MPAVVLFSMIVGVALIGVPNKRPLLDVLATAGQAVSKATSFVVALDTDRRVRDRRGRRGNARASRTCSACRCICIGYVGVSLLLSLWVLPGLVAALTPIPYRALISRTRDALVTAFMTTSLFAVLPLLTEQAKALVREYAGARRRAGGRDRRHRSGLLQLPAHRQAPVAQLRAVRGLVRGRAACRCSDYPRLAGTGLLVLFGNVNAAIPFLLDMLRIPADTFQLFMTSGIVNARFGTLLAAVHTLAIAVLGTCAVAGTLTFNAQEAAALRDHHPAAAVGVVGGARAPAAARAGSHRTTKDTTLTGMGLLHDRGTATAPSPVVVAAPPHARRHHVGARSRPRRAASCASGTSRTACRTRSSTARGELVGFDVEMALQLARDLGVRAELVPVDRTVLEPASIRRSATSSCRASP